MKYNIFTTTFNGIFGSIEGIATVSGTNIWPNVLSSVAELNAASFQSIISSVGGAMVFLIAMLGLVLLTLDFKSKNNKFNLYNKIILGFATIWTLMIIKGNVFVSLTANSALVFLVLLFLPVGIAMLLSILNDNKSNKIFLSLLLSIWMAGTIYMSLNGVRFILLLAPAFSIAFGIGLYYFAKIINNFFTKEFKIQNKFKQSIAGTLIVGLLFLTLYVPMFNQANAISNGTLPNFDDAWYNSMYKIEENSKENAIITSWWDFGHFFAAVSNRGVTFDGGSQTTPRAHWVGKLLMENDEQKSLDMLRMLVCGGNEAHNTMLEATSGTAADAVKINKIIYNTFGQSIEETKNTIKNNKYYTFTQETIDKTMNYLACQSPPENFVITSEDMVGKAGVWAHWGSWDFTKKYVHDNYNTKTAKEIANEIDENTTLIQQYIDELKEIDVKAETQNIKRENLINQWFAPYPSYIPIQNSYTYPCLSNNNTITCQNGIEVDMFTGQIKAQGFQNQLTFNNLVYPLEDNKLNIVKQNESGDIDVLLIPSGQNSFNSMLMQKPLGASLFTKLFYLNGYGTEHFENFDDVRSVTGVRVIVWKVNWELEEIEEISIEPQLELDSIEFNTTEEILPELIEENNTNISN